MIKLSVVCRVSGANRTATFATKAAPKPATKKAETLPKRPRTALISCKRNQFNLFQHENSDAKFGTLPLASKGWLHQKSKGDFFVLNASVSGVELQQNLHRDGLLESGNMELHPQLLENLRAELGIKQLTLIQAKAMPIVHDNRHTLIAAETGCGKTIAYLLPILNRLLEKQPPERKLNSPRTLILTPGRELAMQIANVAERLVQGTDLKVKYLLGGNTKQIMMSPQFEEVDVLVATLGALSKLVTTGIYRMEHVRHLVLDEADTLLDDTFTDKLTYFLRRFPVSLSQT